MEITYNNKTSLNQNGDIPAINKVTADDMNEIKNVVNSNYSILFNKIKYHNQCFTASPSSNLTLTTSNITKIPLDTFIGTNFSNIILDDGNVVVGSGVNRIMVSAQILFLTGGTGSNGRRGLQIQKNGVTVHYCNIPSTETYTGCSVAPFILDVQENDVITLCGLNQGTTGSIVGPANTFITVRVLDNVV